MGKTKKEFTQAYWDEHAEFFIVATWNTPKQGTFDFRKALEIIINDSGLRQAFKEETGVNADEVITVCLLGTCLDFDKINAAAKAKYLRSK